MSWNSTAPLGSVSVKANRVILGDNTTYIETTMGNSVVGTNTSTTRDHFWNVGSNEDGRHRFIQSVGFTSNAVAPNDVYPVLGAGMQTILFPLLTNGEVQWFHKNQDNNNKIYQFIPNFLTGSIIIPSGSSYTNMVAVPNNSYGEIFMYNTDGNSDSYTGQTGFFKARGGIAQTWALMFAIAGSSGADNSLKFANGPDASGLNLRVRRSGASSSQQNWGYRITYRAL